MKDNKLILALDKFKFKKTIEIYIYYILIILLFEFAFCNPTFTLSILKMNIDFSSYVFSFARIFMYVFLLIFLYFIKNNIILSRYELYNNNIMYKKSKKNTIFIALIIGILIFLTIYTAIIADLSLISLTIIFILFISLLFIMRFFGKNSIVNIMMICCLMFVYSIVTDIYHPIDEKIHFISAYNLAQGNFDFDDPIFDQNFNNLPGWGNFNLSANYNIHYTKSEYKIVNETEMVLNKNSKYLYLPAAAGIKLAQLLDGTIMDVFYYGRIFNALIALLGIFFILKILPIKKNVLYICLTIPYFLLISSSYSVDGIGITSIFILIAYTLKLYNKNENISIMELLILLFLILPIILFKSGIYIFSVLIFLILPFKSIFKNNKSLKKIFIITVLLFIGIFIFKILTMNWDSGDTRGGDTNLTKQLLYLINNPIFAIKVYILHTLNTFFNITYYTELNASLFFPTYASYLTLPYLFAVIYVSLADNSKIFVIKEKAIFFITAIILFVFSSTTMLLAFTQIGDSIIRGYQARYTWPLIPLLLFCIANKKIEIHKSSNYELNVFTLLLFINYIYIFINIFSRIL